MTTKYYEWQIINGRRRKVEVFYETPNVVPHFSKESPPPHGNHLRYYSYGCRCRPCTSAATTYARNRRHEAYRTTDYEASDFPHGTPHGYSNLGCRCTLCRLAMRDHQRQYPESQERKTKRNEAKRLKRAKARADNITPTRKRHAA